MFVGKKSLFEIEVRKNLRLCTITDLIPICSRDGYQTAIMLRQPRIGVGYRIRVVLSRRHFSVNRLGTERALKITHGVFEM